MKRIALLSTLLAVLAGCGDNPSGPDANAHIGAYTLVSVNGAGLPASIGTIEGFDASIVSGSASLNADMTASFSVRFRLTQGTTSFEDTAEDVGTYMRNGNTIHVTWSQGDQDTLVFDEARGELTASGDGDVLVFRK